MNVVFTIAGRKAIPVRALPYVTNWVYGTAPDGLVHALANGDESMVVEGYRIKNRYALRAFRLKDTRYSPVHPDEWGGYLPVAMDSLTKKLQADERIEDENYDQWRQKAVLKLPSGAFVWLDEFQTWFSLTRPLDQNGIPSQDDDEEIEFRQEPDDLYFTPFVPDELATAI